MISLAKQSNFELWILPILDPQNANATLQYCKVHLELLLQKFVISIGPGKATIFPNAKLSNYSLPSSSPWIIHWTGGGGWHKEGGLGLKNLQKRGRSFFVAARFKKEVSSCRYILHECCITTRRNRLSSRGRACARTVSTLQDRYAPASPHSPKEPTMNNSKAMYR